MINVEKLGGSNNSTRLAKAGGVEKKESKVSVRSIRSGVSNPGINYPIRMFN
jgi:hypothetical protein